VLSLNGRCVLSYEHGTLLSVDSMLEQIFKANVHTKQVEVWYINDLLKKQSQELLTPGINGIRRSAMDHYLYLSNTDRTMMFRLAIDPFDYRLKGQLETIVKNIICDDFTIDRMRGIYATTHVQNSLMRLTTVKDGGDMREELRMLVDGLAGVTSCVFGRTYEDRTEFDSIITVIRRREGDEHKKSTTSDHYHPQRCSAGRLINSPINPLEMKSIFHSRLIVSGGDVPLSMNTYIRTHSSSTCTIFITIFLVAFVAVVVLCLNLFYMDQTRSATTILPSVKQEPINELDDVKCGWPLANENKRRRTDIPSWIDDASSLEKIQVRFASRSSCLVWTVSRSSTRSKWHIGTMNTSTRSVRRPSMISVTGPVSSLLEGHTNIPFSYS
jgi:hypothetical protein